MIFSKDLLFVHVPKTGGMSVTRYLLEVLPRPIYYSVDRRDERITDEGIHQFPGIRHETLAEARDIVREYGFDIPDFPLILAVLRNPYAIEVSRYKYMQQDYAWLSGSVKELALNEDFVTFALKSSYHGGSSRPLDDYFLLEGKAPPNLRILRLESLLEELKSALRGIGIEKVAELPHENTSFHGDYRLYYSKAAEEIVYQKYRWAFDAGWYDRLDPGDVTEVEALKQELRDLKLEVCAEKQEVLRVEQAYRALERWAHELEARLTEHEAFIRLTRPWRQLAGPLRDLWRRLAFRGGKRNARSI